MRTDARMLLARSPIVVGADDNRDDAGDGASPSPAPAPSSGGGGQAARIRNAAPALAAARPGLNDSATEMFLGQVEAEDQFGYAFTTPDGSPSHNWGALYAPGDRGTIPVGDTSDGKPFTANAAWNSSAVVGARQFVQLIEGSYAPALERASAGDAWGYARALWRDGPGSARPSYYGGFPPGHKWGAPAGVPLHSPLDDWYRITAYAKMVYGAAQAAANALGKPLAVHLSIPPAPAAGGPSPTPAPSPSSSSSSSSGVLALGLAGLGVFAARFLR